MGIVGELFVFCYQQAQLSRVNQTEIPAKDKNLVIFALSALNQPTPAFYLTPFSQ